MPYHQYFNVNDLWWHEKPIPSWWHRCKPQTFASVHGDTIARCACGATRFLNKPGPWIERNSRRKEEKKRKKKTA